MFIFGQLTENLAHQLTLELKPMGVMHQLIEDSISKLVVTDAGVPLVGVQSTAFQLRVFSGGRP